MAVDEAAINHNLYDVELGRLLGGQACSRWLTLFLLELVDPVTNVCHMPINYIVCMSALLTEVSAEQLWVESGQFGEG